MLNSGARRGRRLWRLRKRHDQIDAQLVALGDRRVELQFLFNAELVYRRRWSRRAPAVAAATDKRGELERSGWTAHW